MGPSLRGAQRRGNLVTLKLLFNTCSHIKNDAMQKQPAVYLLTNKPNGILYIGVTSNLPRRVWEHKNKVVKGFSQKYNLTKLVYFEIYEDMAQAITREKQLKAGSRSTKIELIESLNPNWEDLYQDICR